jgi:hypothetical protein
MKIFPARVDLVTVATNLSGASSTLSCANAEAQPLTSSRPLVGDNGTRPLPPVHFTNVSACSLEALSDFKRCGFYC